jgi:uncharacterized protein YjbI with pentapeptide repeats
MAGLQAQASTANVAQAQKAEAFTPSGRLQRQGKTTRKHVEMLIAAIDKHLAKALDAGEIKLNSLRHLHELRQQRQSLQDQLEEPSKEGIDGLSERISGGKKFSCENGYFVGLDLRGLDFSGADFSESKFQYSNFSRAILDRAILDWTDLRGAKFEDASLMGTSLHRANMLGANLHRAQCQGAKFQDAALQNAFGVPLGIEPLKWPNLQNTILEYCINQHKLSTNAPKGVRRKGPRIKVRENLNDLAFENLLLKIRILEQQRQANVRELLDVE